MVYTRTKFHETKKKKYIYIYISKIDRVTVHLTHFQKNAVSHFFLPSQFTRERTCSLRPYNIALIFRISFKQRNIFSSFFFK